MLSCGAFTFNTHTLGKKRSFLNLSPLYFKYTQL